MKRAVLTQNQLSLLEELIANFGTLVTFEQIASVMQGDAPAHQRLLVHRLTKAGWLVRIKNGLYQIADITTLGTLTLSRYLVAQLLLPDSYVSFESALQFHGLHDQLLNSTNSVALRQHKSVELYGYSYHYLKTNEKYFFGWNEETIEGKRVRIASPEKALIDIIQFQRSDYTVDVVLEKLQSNPDSFELERLQNMLAQANQTTARIFGFLLDRLGLDSSKLQQPAKKSGAVGRLTPASTQYDAKWRMYYEPALIAPYQDR